MSHRVDENSLAFARIHEEVVERTGTRLMSRCLIGNSLAHVGRVGGRGEYSRFAAWLA